MDGRRTSHLLEMADEVIIVPEAGDVTQYRDRDQTLARLNELEKPRDRLIQLYKSAFDPRVQPVHESLWIRKFTLMGFFAGMAVGGVLRSPDIHQTYQRRHNADVFDSRYRGNRHFYDTLIRGVVGRGLRAGISISVLLTAFSSLTLGSVVYRGDLYLPDWIIGTATIGALSRLWIGTRGMVAGGIIGASGGLMCFGLTRGLEYLSGSSVSHMRYLHQLEYTKASQARLRRNQAAAEEPIKEIFSNSTN